MEEGTIIAIEIEIEMAFREPLLVTEILIITIALL